MKEDRGSLGQKILAEGMEEYAHFEWGCTSLYLNGSLGMILDSQLSLENQVAAMSRDAFAQLQLVCLLQPHLSNSNLTRVVHALVTSRHYYCNTLYVGLPCDYLKAALSAKCSGLGDY